MVQELAEEFEAETGIKIDFQITPDDQWRDLLKTKLDSGEAYDIMCVDADPLSLYSRINPEQNCVDLSDQEWVSRMDPIVPSREYPIMTKFMESSSRGPECLHVCIIKDIFADLSLEVPKNL